MRINSKSSTDLRSRRSFGSRLQATDRGLEKLSSGYRIGPTNDGTAVLVSQKLQADHSGRPQLIRSAGARPFARAS